MGPGGATVRRLGPNNLLLPSVPRRCSKRLYPAAFHDGIAALRRSRSAHVWGREGRCGADPSKPRVERMGLSAPDDWRSHRSKRSRNRPATRRILLAGALFACGLSLAVANRAAAHVPHDDLRSMAISPEFSRDRTVFIVARGNVFRSVDGGYRWHRLSRGLQHGHRGGPDAASARAAHRPAGRRRRIYSGPYPAGRRRPDAWRG